MCTGGPSAAEAARTCAATIHARVNLRAGLPISREMSRWRAFVDVLDEILGDGESAPSMAEAAHRSPRIASSPLYAYSPNQAPNRFWSAPAPRPTQLRAAFDGLKRFVHQAPAPPAQHRVPSAPRPGRTLKPAEESALRTLIGLGATMDQGFTAKELRSTFRTLAQRYHPDRHPYATDAERKRLAAAFAELTGAYTTLLESSTK